MPGINTLPVLECNKYGHMVFSIIGTGLTGAEEKKRHNYGEQYLEYILMSSSYDLKHRLVAGQKYNIVLLPGEHFGDLIPTTSDIAREARRFGYREPLAGIVFGIEKEISFMQMKEMGLRYIAVFHEPICDAVLYVSARYVGESIIETALLPERAAEHSGIRWFGKGAFAFLE
jgi:hypothetical protein